MRIQEILTESFVDDRVIIDAATAVADKIIDNWAVFMYPSIFGHQRGRDDSPSAFAGYVRQAAINLRNIEDPLYQQLGQTQVRISELEGGQQAFAGRLGKEFAIFLNYEKFDGYGKDISGLRPWLVETLSHELRHVLDLIKRDASPSKKKFNFSKSKYYQKPHIADEPDSTQSEVNAYFTQILHQVEADLKHNKITDVNRALKFGQESLEDSQLADVIFGGWDNNNPVLRRLSARMAQFIHNLYQQ